jgi:serine/threonine protein kinase
VNKRSYPSVADNQSVPPGPDRVGQLVKQKWRVDQLLGSGGMASVYSATHRNGNRVAIKFLHPMYVADQSLRARFQREGYVANLIEHAAVVRVLDDDVTDDGGAFLVMELLTGETLQSRLNRESALPLQEALVIAYQVLDVLVKAHGKGIVHRDIKPDNVFLTTSGQIKVLDFGIARLAELSERGGVNQTRQGALLGTPAYMAPEQALERPESVDGQTDVWAVGATLFRMLTGRCVRLGDTFSQQLLAAATQPVPPVSSVLPELPLEIGQVVDRATAFQRHHRWASAAEMQDNIRPLLSVVPEQAPPPGPLVVTQQQPLLRAAAPHAHPSPAHGPRTPSYAISPPPIGHPTMPMGDRADGAPPRRRRKLALVGLLLAAGLAAGASWRARHPRSPEVASERALKEQSAAGAASGEMPPAQPQAVPEAPARVQPDLHPRLQPRLATPTRKGARKGAGKPAVRPPQAPARPPDQLMNDDELLGRRH